MTEKLIEKLYTIDDLLALPDDHKRYELHNGEIVELGTSSRNHTKLGSWLAHVLWDFIIANHLGGEITGADGTFKLGKYDTSVPDMAYVSVAKTAALTDETVFYPFAPDLAVEIKSPSTSKRKMKSLAAMYLNASALLVWTIDLEKQIVTVYQAEGQPIEVSGDGELDGYDVLPGFRLYLSDLFQVISK